MAGRLRVVYVSGGGADIINAHRNWAKGVDDPSQVSLTFSGQIEDFFDHQEMAARLVSFRSEDEEVSDGDISVSHLTGRVAGGARYHLEQLRRATIVLSEARTFKADVVLIDSGALPFYTFRLFRICGFRVVPVLHNALWPEGYRPSSGKFRAFAALDNIFWRSTTNPVLAVSPTIVRQLREVGVNPRVDIITFNPLFRSEHFESVPPPPADKRPFNIMFVGRATRDKGLLLLAEIAALVDEARPGAVRWTVCGDGPDLATFRELIVDRGVSHLFDVRGWTSPAALRDIYASIHAVIVPTTSGFAEGMAMTAIEAVLAGRPLISNPVVPALEILADAAVSAKTDDPCSYADGIIALIDDPVVYERKRSARATLREQFVERRFGLEAALVRAFRSMSLID